MWNLLVLCTALFLAPPAVSVKTLDGSTHEGQLEALEADHLVLVTADGRQQLPYRQLLTVKQTKPPAAVPDAASVWIELVGGSRLEATALTISEGKANISLRDGRQISLASEEILQGRIIELEGDTLTDFQEITAEEAEGDLLVIRRPSGALDQLEGIIHSLDKDVLVFEFDNEKLPVGREKVAGFRFFQSDAQQLSKPMCLVQTTDGCLLVAGQLALAEDTLSVTTVAGSTLEIPLEQLGTLDFSSGNLVYLSDLTMESSNWRPYLSAGAVSETLKRLYRPRRDTTLTGKPLVLANQEFARGLAIHSRTEINYRLTDDYRTFQALVGIDPAMGENGHVELVILADGKQLYRQAISGKDDARSIELDLTGVKRLTILVDFGEQLDIGDHLLLCNARLTK
jgi:hypothetical protein